MNRKALLKAKHRVVECLGKRQLADARKTCEQLCRQFPEDPECWSLLGAIEGESANATQAANAYKKAISLRPDYYEALYNLACTQMAAGHADEAMGLFERVLRIRPDAVDAMNNLGVLLKERGQLDAACRHFERAIALQPGFAMALYNMGNVLMDRGDPESAVFYYQKAVAAAPQFADAFFRLGHANRALFLRSEAAACFREALRINPDHAAARFALAEVLVLLGRHAESVAEYDRLLQADAANPELLAGKAEALEKQGELQQAYDLVVASRETSSGARLALTYANLCSRFDSCDDALAWLNTLLGDTRLGPEERAGLHQAKGRILDRAHDYDAAFAEFLAANRLKQGLGGASAHEADMDAMLSWLNAERFAALPRSAETSQVPVFIVGMPRSGTSLVEQIIASHPQAFGAGELPYIHRSVSALPGLIGDTRRVPECLEAVKPKVLNDLAARYLRELRKPAPQALRITDKLPHNFMWLGIIELLFPHARVIHCSRDPLDNCLSLFTTRGFNVHHAYAFDLQQLGRHYRKYQALMARWKEVLKLPLLELRYEQLVEDFDAQTRRLIEFCGLDWDDSCLHYYASGRASTTLSYDQVRRPIYRSSVGRWRHYERHLGPLIETLGESLPCAARSTN